MRSAFVAPSAGSDWSSCLNYLKIVVEDVVWKPVGGPFVSTEHLPALASETLSVYNRRSEFTCQCVVSETQEA